VLGLGGDDPRRLGPYRVRAVIGDGGMGRVYLATSPAGRPVAVKVIGPGLANRPGYRERFAREARAAMSVSGLYTASVVDADTAGQQPYLATEYVPAPSLAESVVKTGPLPPSAVFALAGGLAEALVAIHRAGLVHRDVKPHNILLAADGPVVIDFGIAVGDETSLTAVGMTVGTPGYIAPEVLRGKDPSALSDVFSLGCVLVYAARGSGPFGTGEPLAIAHRSATEDPDLTGVPDDVRAIVTPMLQRDPSRRPTPAQLLQHVSLSSSAVLHDGLWLPDGVRHLLDERKHELQRALGGAAAPAPQPPQAQFHAPPPPAQQRQPIAFNPTPPGNFGAPHGMPPAPVPARGRRGFLTAVIVGGAVVMVGAIMAVLLVNKANGSARNNDASGGSTSPAVTHVATANGLAATTGASATPSDSGTSDSETDTSDAVSYKPGTYPVNQQLATDLLGNTVTLDSITVNSDGSVSAKLSFTASMDAEWTCSGAKAGEAALEADDKVLDYSTGSDCTRYATRSWAMTSGETVSESEYFASAPTGGGSWSFAIDSGADGTTEFSGAVTDISIPTQ
jgi:serine/threonine protein kinase